MNFFEWLWAHPTYFLWLYIAIMTLILFVIMGVDKYRAIHNKSRVAESTLFLLAIIGGSIGGILATYAFRHKTKHKSFTIGFPLILILQIALGVFIYLYVR